MKKNTSPHKRNVFLYCSKQKNKSKFRIVVWDLECSDLKSNRGVIISSAIKELGGDVVTHTNKKLGIDGLDDKDLLIQIRDELNKADMIVGFYHLGFDLPFINTRLLKYGEELVKPKLQIDLYRVVKRFHFNTDRRNLDTVAKYLSVPLKKTHIDWEEWRKAAINGDKKAIAQIVFHNVVDVKVTEMVFEKVKGLIKSISVA